jgi:hypothetical protein
MARLRDILRISLSALLSLTLLTNPGWGTPAAVMGLGTVVSADRAHVGTAAASVGTTVFAGDRLDTDQHGSLQVRTSAARLLLSGASKVTWGNEGGAPAATLTTGTATFSMASAKALSLRVATAVIRPKADQATIGSVTVLNPKELTVQCSRGALMLTVIDDTLVIPEGTAYHIVLDPDAYPAADNPAKAWGSNQPPRKSGRNRFIFFLIFVTAAVSVFAISEALESPYRP